MSLINQMLRDLEDRRLEETGAPGWLSDLRPAQREMRPWRVQWPLTVLGVAALAFLASGGARLEGIADGVLDGLGGGFAAVSDARSLGKPDAEPEPVAAPRTPEPVGSSARAPAPVSASDEILARAAARPPGPPRSPEPFRLKLAYALPNDVPPRDGLELEPELRQEAERLNALLAAAPPAAPSPAPRPASRSETARSETARSKTARSKTLGSEAAGSETAGSETAGSETAAVAVHKRALPQSDQQRAEASYRQGLAALRAGRDRHGLALLRDALAHWAGHTQAREVLAARLMRAGDLDGALALLSAGARLAPRHAGFAKLRARILVELERLEEALAVLAVAPPEPAADPEYHALRAATLQRAGRHAEAAGAYRAALETRPRAGVWWMGLAISLEATGADVDALEAFSRALDSGALAGDVRRFVESRISALRG